jgi:catechol 2,3-dioxygenase-like lactoylglutathione lyase family enzyme
MNVQRICFLGTRTPNFDATSALFRAVLGLRNVHTEVGWSIFQLPSGRSDFVEVFGPEHENANVFPAEVSEGIVVAFAVDDLAARQELVAAKVELIGELVWGATSVACASAQQWRLTGVSWSGRLPRGAGGRTPLGHTGRVSPR